MDEAAQYAPDDAICSRCNQFVPNNERVERYLAARRIKYYDERKGRVVMPMGRIRYCHCTEGAKTETARPRYAE